MPRSLKNCAAPAPFGIGLCGREFLATVPTKLYCSPTCRHRALRYNQKRNAFASGVRAPAHEIVTKAQALDDVITMLEKKGTAEDQLKALGFGTSVEPKPEDL